MEILTENDEKYKNAKQSALAFMKNHRKIIWWCLKEIKIENEAFNHLIWKNKNHKRLASETYVRFLCFIHIDKVLKNLNLYQEYKCVMEETQIKRKWKFITQKIKVEYFGFIWILFDKWLRIKVVVKKNDGWKHGELVSVIPAWETIWYKDFKYKGTFYEELE